MSNITEEYRYPFEIAAGIDIKTINFAYPPSNKRRYAIKEDWEAAKRELAKEWRSLGSITEERFPTQLLPCPFCQCTSVLPSLYRGSYFVLCEACETQGPPSINSAIAVEAWNRRAQSASAPVLSEEMREALLAGAMALEFRSRHWQGTGADEAYDKPAALLRAMAESR